MENYFLMNQLGSEDFVLFVFFFLKENSYLQQTRWLRRYKGRIYITESVWCEFYTGWVVTVFSSNPENPVQVETKTLFWIMETPFFLGPWTPGWLTPDRCPSYSLGLPAEAVSVNPSPDALCKQKGKYVLKTRANLGSSKFRSDYFLPRVCKSVFGTRGKHFPIHVAA